MGRRRTEWRARKRVQLADHSCESGDGATIRVVLSRFETGVSTVPARAVSWTRVGRLAAVWHNGDPELRSILDSVAAALERLGAARTSPECEPAWPLVPPALHPAHLADGHLERARAVRSLDNSQPPGSVQNGSNTIGFNSPRGDLCDSRRLPSVPLSRWHCWHAARPIPPSQGVTWPSSRPSPPRRTPVRT
jgi:hypothetical protein